MLLRLTTDELSEERWIGCDIGRRGDEGCRRPEAGLVRLVWGMACLDVWGRTLSDRPISFLMASGDSEPNTQNKPVLC